jgi:hypothetical protein
MYFATPISLCWTTYSVCFSRERGVVPTVAHICSFNLAEVSVSSARAYFLVWGWQSSGGYGSLVRNCRKIEEHAALGLATGRSNYGLLLEWWGKYFNVGQAKELEAELERLPKCDNDERWGFIRAKLAV